MIQPPELENNSLSALRAPLSVAIALGCLLLGCASNAVAGPEALRVASDLDHPPFAWVDAAGRPAGSEVEMMQALAADLGRDLLWVRRPFDELLGLIEVGEADVLCATLGISPERARRVAFTLPYYETAIAVVVRRGSGEPAELRDLAGRRVGADAGTTSERALGLHLPQARATSLASKQGPAAALLESRIDAAVMDAPDADLLVARHPERLRRLAQELEREHYALAVGREQQALLAELNAALSRAGFASPGD